MSGRHPWSEIKFKGDEEAIRSAQTPTERTLALLKATWRAEWEAELLDDEAVQLAASEMAIQEGYNPNSYPVAEWARIRNEYQDRARRVLYAALNAQND